MRKESGAEHIFTDTDAYDDAGKRWDRETEVWIPFKDKPCGTPCPRSEALANRVTFKLRVQEDKQEEGWKMLHTRKPPPSQKWMLGKAFSSAVQQPLSTKRGKGANAHWGVVVKSHGAPPSDIINLGGGDFPKDKQDERRQRPITVMRGMYLARHRLKSTWWIRLPPAMAFGQQGEYYNMWPNMDITLAILFKGHRCDIEAIQPIWPNMDTTLAILFKGHRCDIEAIQPRPLGPEKQHRQEEHLHRQQEQQDLHRQQEQQDLHRQQELRDEELKPVLLEHLLI
ncbi:unnamed protein product, partial [Symbiodinium microadriaticum]